MPNGLELIDRVNVDGGFVCCETESALESGLRHRHHHVICIEYGKAISFPGNFEGMEAEVAGTAGLGAVNHGPDSGGYCMEDGGDLIEEKRE